MPTAYIDRVTDLSYTEHLGVVKTLNRKVRVVFNDGDVIPADFSVLSAAMQTLTDAGIVYLSQPVIPPSTTVAAGYEALVLVERTPSLAEQDPCCVDIALKYEHVIDGPHQMLYPASDRPAIIYGKGKSSISQKTANFYYPDPTQWGDLTKRVPILVGYAFPSWDLRAVGLTQYPGLPGLVLQTGEVNVPFPEKTFQIQGVVQTDNPQSVADQFIACINSVPWMNNSDPFTWICSQVEWDVLNPVSDPPTYKFTLDFQYNIDTWNPTAAFNDQGTGRPPAGLKSASILSTHGVLSYAPYPYATIGVPEALGSVPQLTNGNSGTGSMAAGNMFVVCTGYDPVSGEESAHSGEVVTTPALQADSSLDVVFSLEGTTFPTFRVYMSRYSGEETLQGSPGGGGNFTLFTEPTKTGPYPPSSGIPALSILDQPAFIPGPAPSYPVPAGYWQVPFLKAVDFNSLIGDVFY